MTSPAIHVTGMDHIVLVCRDIEATISWYLDVLGLEPSRIDEWRRGEAPFPSVRVDEGTIIDLIRAGSDAEPEHCRLDHICLVIDPTDLHAVAASGAFDVVDGPDTRFGARGDGTSLYVRDPEGTVVELRYY